MQDSPRITLRVRVMLSELLRRDVAGPRIRRAMYDILQDMPQEMIAGIISIKRSLVGMLRQNDESIMGRHSIVCICRGYLSQN